MKKPLLQRLAPLIGIVLFAVAIWVLHRALRQHNIKDILRLMRELPVSRLLAAFGLTALSYLTLTFYDAFAFRFIKRVLPWRRIAFASFLGYVFSHNMGASFISGGSVRYRLYSAWGLSAGEISLIVLFCGITFWLGLCLVGSAVLLIWPPPLPEVLGPHFDSSRSLGLLCLVIVAVSTVVIVLRRNPIRIRSWTIPVPGPNLYVAQMIISCLDWIIAGSVLWVLLPPAPGLTFAMFLGAFMLAQIAGMLLHVPGGLGIFEAIMLALLSPPLAENELAACLLAYRVVYYLIPFGLATLMLAGHELFARSTGMKRMTGYFAPWVARMLPQVMAFATFVAGALLLFSGATPASPDRMDSLHRVVPLAVIEGSHVLGSVTGMALMVLAGGLQRRVRRAWQLSSGLLLAGAAFALVKGVEWEEVLLLLPLFFMLVSCRGSFPRRTAMLSERISAPWASAVFVAFATSVWLGHFAYRHLQYGPEVWTQFSLDGDTSRFLRASAAAAAVGLAYGLARVLAPAQPRPALPSAAELERAAAIARGSPDTSANLALLGDKALLISASGRSFLMYGAHARHLVALGGPVGAADEGSELVWSFRELCERESALPVFHEVGPAHVPLCLDLGLGLVRLGEAAHVRLPDFPPAGVEHVGPVRDARLAEEQGATFELVPAEQVPALLPQLAALDEAWRSSGAAQEKFFSLARFEPSFVARFPAAVVRQRGRLVAFASVWSGGDHGQLSADVYRQAADAPPGTMDLLFTSLMSWGRQQGWASFDLGTAPPDAPAEREPALVTTRLGELTFRHGEHFATPGELRAWKQRFSPEWEPRFIVCPGGPRVPGVIASVAALIAHGWRPPAPRGAPPR